jgi:hypothetical protein
MPARLVCAIRPVVRLRCVVATRQRVRVELALDLRTAPGLSTRGGPSSASTFTDELTPGLAAAGGLFLPVRSPWSVSLAAGRRAAGSRPATR